MTVAPLLVLGWGNRSRGDDALGPLLVDRLQAWATSAGVGVAVDFIEDYQLQPEHALDLSGRRQVLFADAGLSCAAPFELQTLAPRRDRSFTSHALSPQSLLQVLREIDGGRLPECSLLEIRGEQFELGAPPCDTALRNLERAVEAGRRWLLERAAPGAVA